MQIKKLTFFPLVFSFYIMLVIIGLLGCSGPDKQVAIIPQIDNYIIFETGSGSQDELDFFTDLVLLRFNGDSAKFVESIESWRNKDYEVGVIFSSNWEREGSDFASFVRQKFKGEKLSIFDFVQKDQELNPLFNKNFKIPIIPDSTRLKYLKSILKNWINLNIKTIVLETPEYFAGAGFNRIFKDYWWDKTGTRWQNPQDSTDIWFQSGQLKQKMLLEFIKETVNFGREYADQKNKTVKFFLASPGSIAGSAKKTIHAGTPSLRLSNIAGVIGQYSGATYPDFIFQGLTKPRKFAPAFLNYSWFVNSVNFSQQQLILSINPAIAKTDPGSQYLWIDYFETFIAALMQPAVKQFNFLSMPENFLLKDGSAAGKMKKDFNYKLAIMAYILEYLKKIPAGKIFWSADNFPKTGILFSDTYMFQRGGPWTSEMESFYQLALPLLYRGVPIRVVPLERISDQVYLNQFDVLLMSYEGYKPLAPDVHSALYQWVRRKGGVLFFYLGISNRFDEMEKWWAEKYDRPHEHLFELLKTGFYPQARFHKVGSGIVYIEHSSPRELAKKPLSGEIIWNTYLNILNRYSSFDLEGNEKNNHLVLHRGPFDLFFVADEVVNPEVLFLEGNFIDLFSENTPIIKQKNISPGQAGILLNLDYYTNDTTAVVFSSSRISDIQIEKSAIKFISRWQKNTPGITFIKLPGSPSAVLCREKTGETVPVRQTWLNEQNLLRIEYTSSGSPIQFEIRLSL